MPKHYWYSCIDVTKSDGNRLNWFINQELQCYNYLIDQFQRLITTNKSFLSTITKQDIDGITSLYAQPDFQHPTVDPLFGKLPFKLSPTTLANIHTEFVLHLISQSKTPRGQRLLQPQTLDSKRHVQLTKKDISLSYNYSTKQTLITCPYLDHPVTTNWDLTPRNNWTIAILHQQPVRLVTPNSPWFIEFRCFTGRYDLDYLDMLPTSGDFHKSSLKKFT